MFLDQAHTQWRKRFEAEHTHNTDNIDVVSDELKRLNTTVTEARSMLSSILNSGSDRQIFVVQSRLHTQILDHYKRLKALKIWDQTESYIFDPKNLKKLIKTIKFENLTPSKRFSDALDRISVSGKSMISDGLPSPKPCLASLELMSVTFHKIFDCQSEMIAYFGLFIDNNRIIVSNESEGSLVVYESSSNTAKLVSRRKCDNIPYDICYAYSMNKIYVAFGKFVVQYEIKNVGTTFVEIERIQVEKAVMGIAKTIDGFFTANKTSASFRWSDFSIRLNISYVQSGLRPFICSSFCGGKVAYTTRQSVIVMDTKGKRLSEYSCSGSIPFGLSFDSEDNIIVCLDKRELKQIIYDGKSSRCILKFDRSGSILSGLENIIFHPEGHKLMNFCIAYYFQGYQRLCYNTSLFVFEVLTK